MTGPTDPPVCGDECEIPGAGVKRCAREPGHGGLIHVSEVPDAKGGLPLNTYQWPTGAEAADVAHEE